MSPQPAHPCRHADDGRASTRDVVHRPFRADECCYCQGFASARTVAADRGQISGSTARCRLGAQDARCACAATSRRINRARSGAGVAVRVVSRNPSRIIQHTPWNRVMKEAAMAATTARREIARCVEIAARRVPERCRRTIASMRGNHASRYGDTETAHTAQPRKAQAAPEKRARAGVHRRRGSRSAI